MEQALLPDILSKFDAIKKTYAKVNRAYTKRLAAIVTVKKYPRRQKNVLRSCVMNLLS